MATKEKKPKTTKKSLQDSEHTIRDEDVPAKFKKYWKNPKYNQRLVTAFIRLQRTRPNMSYEEFMKDGVYR